MVGSGNIGGETDGLGNICGMGPGDGTGEGVGNGAGTGTGAGAGNGAGAGEGKGAGAGAGGKSCGSSWRDFLTRVGAEEHQPTHRRSTWAAEKYEHL